MNGVPEATPIILTEAERTELEALARSTKTEYRLRQGGGRGRGQPGDWPRGWLHDRHGIEMARALRRQSTGRP